jgi:hypothetical protein
MEKISQEAKYFPVASLQTNLSKGLIGAEVCDHVTP